MKNIRSAFFIVVISYLIWSFISLNIDPHYWGLIGRITYIISIIATYILYTDNKNLKDKEE